MAAVTSQRVTSQAGTIIRGGPATAAPSLAVRTRRVIPGRGPVPCDGASPGTLHGSRLTPRGRMVVAVVWLVLLGIAVLVIARPSDGASAVRGGDAPTSTVQVRPGDTLWGLAAAAQPNSDPREVIDAIVAINGLASPGDIRPGDTLVVPLRG